MFAYTQQPVQPVIPQPAPVDTRSFGLVLPGYPVVFDHAFQRVAPDRWILPIEFAQVLLIFFGCCFHTHVRNTEPS
jgi:hypothetical protein